MTEPLLHVCGATKRFDTRYALRDVTCEVRAGSTVGLIGANGAGKTTLIRASVGLLPLDGGTIRSRVSRTATAYLPEERGLYLRQPPLRTLAYLGELRGMRRSDARGEAASWIARLELPQPHDRPLERFSKGQQQKAQLASAFMGSPELILLDEPLAGLDPLNVQLVGRLIADARQRGAGVLLSAHQLQIVEQWCDEVVMLSAGRVVMQGSPAAIRADGRSLEREFLNRSAEGAAR
jgi:ABC-2 type transport system ATP-binding protein